MPRRPPLGLLLAALLLAGCSDAERPVSVAPPTPDPACSGLELPQELPQGLQRRTTTPSSSATAAWGDPAVVLRCGVPAGSARDELFTINDVEWAMHDVGDAREWTTRGLRTNVEVTVPDAYGSQAELIGVLSRPVLRALGR